MQVVKFREGLWQWGCPHPAWVEGCDWDRLVWSTYFEAADATVLIDPLLPAQPDDLDRFWRALDRDVERRGLPVTILLTCSWHGRSSADVAARYAADITAPSRGGAVPAGVEVRDPGVPPPNHEVAFRLPGDVLVTGDLIHVHNGRLAVAPASSHDETEASITWYRQRIGPVVADLLAPVPSLILTGHGSEDDPLHIQAFVDAHVR